MHCAVGQCQLDKRQGHACRTWWWLVVVVAVGASATTRADTGDGEWKCVARETCCHDSAHDTQTQQEVTCIVLLMTALYQDDCLFVSGPICIGMYQHVLELTGLRGILYQDNKHSVSGRIVIIVTLIRDFSSFLLCCSC